MISLLFFSIRNKLYKSSFLSLGIKLKEKKREKLSKKFLFVNFKLIIESLELKKNELNKGGYILLLHLVFSLFEKRILIINLT